MAEALVTRELAEDAVSLSSKSSKSTPGKLKGNGSGSQTATSGSAEKKPRKNKEVEALRTDVEARFTSFEAKLDSLLAVMSSQTGGGETSHTRETARPIVSLHNSLDQEYNIPRHTQVQDQEDLLSLQPGQQEIVDLLGSERSPAHSPAHSTQHSRVSDIDGDQSKERFTKYSNQTLNMLSEMFGEDASLSASKDTSGLVLDESQIQTLKNAWRCENPERVSSYRESYKLSFPIAEEAENLLAVPSLDSMVESLLLKRFGAKAAFGKSHSLYSQPLKSLEKIGYQGQSAARMGIIINLYIQQALSSLLEKLTQKSPNLDAAIQCVRDIFAMSTKSLDQFSRTGAFHHLVRRRAALDDTGLHDLKDLKQQMWNLPLAHEGVFGPGLENKLKERQEKNKQLSELLPEVEKRKRPSTSSPYTQETSWKKPRFDDKRKQSGSFGYQSHGNRKAQGSGRSQAFRNNYQNGSKAAVSSFRTNFTKSN